MKNINGKKVKTTKDLDALPNKKKEKKPMVRISQINYEGYDINFLADKNFVGYSFMRTVEGEDPQEFGHKLLLTSKKRDELVGTIALLWLNAFETIDAIK